MDATLTAGIMIGAGGLTVAVITLDTIAEWVRNWLIHGNPFHNDEG